MRVFLVPFVLALLVQPVGAAADDAVTAPVNPAAFALPATGADAGRRIAFIETTLDDRDGYAKLWKYGWMTVFGIGAVGQFVIGQTAADQKVINDANVGAATAFLGVCGMVISPVDAGGNLRELRAYPGDATDGGAAKLQLAERLLEDTARGERRGRAWQEYVTMALVSGSAGAIMWLYYDQPESFWLKAGSGVAFSTARILTTPRAATRAWERYQAGDLSQPVAGAGAQPGLAFGVGPGLATVTYRF